MYLEADTTTDGSVSDMMDEDEIKWRAQEAHLQSQIAEYRNLLHSCKQELQVTQKLHALALSDLEKYKDDLLVVSRAKTDLTRHMEMQENTLRIERAEADVVKKELAEERALTQRLREEIRLYSSRLYEVFDERLHLVRKASVRGEAPPSPLGWEPSVPAEQSSMEQLPQLSSFLSTGSADSPASTKEDKAKQSVPSRSSSALPQAQSGNGGFRGMLSRALGRGAKTEEEFRQMIHELHEVPPSRNAVRFLTSSSVESLRQEVVCFGDRTGTPEGARGYLWAEAVGNHLGITENLFGRVQRKRDKLREAWTRIGEQQQLDDEALVADWKNRPRVTAKVVFSQTASTYVPGIEEEELYLLGGALEQIPLDVNRTFTAKDLQSLNYHEPIADEIRDLLEAFAVLRPEFGYTQGMNFVAALMVIIFPDSFRAFVCFSNAMTFQPWLTACYTFDMDVVNTHFEVFDDLLLTLLPKLGRHFQQQELKSDLYLVEWWFALFAKSLPLPVVVHLWDAFFLEGEFLLYRASLAILQCFSDALLARPRDECLALLSTWPTVHIDTARLFETMDRVGLTEKKLLASYEKVRKRRNSNDTAMR